MAVEPSDKDYISPTRSFPKDDSEEWKETGFRESDLKEGAKYVTRSDTPKEILGKLKSDGPISPRNYEDDMPTSSGNVHMWRTDRDSSIEDNFLINIERGSGRGSVDSITNYGEAVIEYMNESSKFPSVTEEKPAHVNGASADDGDILEPTTERSGSDDIDDFLEPLKDVRTFVRWGKYDRAEQVASIYGDWGYPEMEDTTLAYIDQEQE